MARRRAQLRLGPKTSDAAELTDAQQGLLANPAFWTAECDLGAEYDIQSKHLREWQPKYSTSKLQRGIRQQFPVSWCHGLLAWHLRMPLDDNQLAELTRLQTAFATKSALTPDLFIKVVRDLDTILFQGTLKGRTLISWEELPTRDGHLLRGSCSGGMLRFKIKIRLGKTCFFSDRKEVLWGTLIREILHAYLNNNAVGGEVACADEHDELFVQSVDRLAERLALPGLGTHEIVGYM
ncbi:hypothetical protein LTR85_006967 [Meristemomyces frigidus]|nr:hypothetical protein LTR85_006967 [Meristemomyces frigidus]